MKGKELVKGSNGGLTPRQTAQPRFGRNNNDKVEDDRVQVNPRPGGICGLTCSCRKQIQEPGPQGWGILKSEEIKYGHDFRRSRTSERLRW
jgi:hypothetical protein